MHSGKRTCEEEIFEDPTSDQKLNLQVIRANIPKNSPEAGKLQLKDILNSDKKEGEDNNTSKEDKGRISNENSGIKENSGSKNNFGWNGGLSTALREINELKKQLEKEKQNNARIKKEFE